MSPQAAIWFREALAQGYSVIEARLLTLAKLGKQS